MTLDTVSFIPEGKSSSEELMLPLKRKKQNRNFTVDVVAKIFNHFENHQCLLLGVRLVVQISHSAITTPISHSLYKQ
jgi:hypothetical protein